MISASVRAAHCADVVGGFKVIAAVVLAQFCAETDRRYAVTGVVLAPLLINVVELLGTDGVVRLETEVALGLHKVDDIVAAALDGVHVGSATRNTSSRYNYISVFYYNIVFMNTSGQ